MQNQQNFSKTNNYQKKILVTGALGQIGTDLVEALILRYGIDSVISSDLKSPEALESIKSQESSAKNIKNYYKIDVLNYNEIAEVVKKEQITDIYHLAAILSASGEKNPSLCWDININGLINILEIAKNFHLSQVICPSSIAVFGPTTPNINTPQQSIIEPTTIYGISKLTGEMLCDYYRKKFAVDVRGLRYPGLISYKTKAGGGTTDYAVEIFNYAIEHKAYQCFLSANTVLPMMYIDDAIRGTIELAEADANKLTNFSNFNFAGLSFSCAELAENIKKYLPDFTVTYLPDFRQQIADSWPQSIDDSEARKQWGWQPKFNLDTLVRSMLQGLGKII